MGGSLSRTEYTAKNATDLMQVVRCTGLMQVANELYQAC